PAEVVEKLAVVESLDKSPMERRDRQGGCANVGHDGSVKAAGHERVGIIDEVAPDGDHEPGMFLIRRRNQSVDVADRGCRSQPPGLRKHLVKSVQDQGDPVGPPQTLKASTGAESVVGQEPVDTGGEVVGEGQLTRAKWNVDRN